MIRLVYFGKKSKAKKCSNLYEQLKDGTMNASFVNISCHLIKINRTYGNPNIGTMAEIDLFFLS